MSTKDYPEDFPDKLDYALHTLSPTQRIAFESWTPKHEREDAKADAAVLSEVLVLRSLRKSRPLSLKLV